MLVILAILAGVIVLAVGGIFGRTGEQAYNLVRDELQLAVTGYMTNTSHELPVTTANNTVIDACLLLGPDELLREVPDGMREANGNCTTALTDSNHYTWVVDGGGNVASVCYTDDEGEECDDAGDGYQGQWP